MRDYGSVQTRFWANPDIQKLSDQAKLLALYLLTGPHTNMLGCFRLPIGYICEDLKWSSETVSKGLGELFQMGFATQDPIHNWVFIHRFLEWNPIENPNQGKSIRRLFEQVPTKSIFFNKLMTILLTHSKYLEEPFRNSLQTLLKPLLNQEQDQEQKQEQGQDQEQEDGGARLRCTRLPETVTEEAPISPLHQEINCSTIVTTSLNTHEATIITIPLNDHTEFPISSQQLDEWRALFPALDILQALRNIRAWNLANANRRKTRSGILRHITAWLAKEQNRAGNNCRENKASSRSQGIQTHNLAVANNWLKQSKGSVIDSEAVILSAGAEHERK